MLTHGKLVKIMSCSSFWYWIKNKNRQKNELKIWEETGMPVPPPHIVKQRKVKEFARRFNCRIFIETGTYKGKMVESVQNVFRKIQTIELDKNLCERAREKFKHKRHIQVLEGNSGTILPYILKDTSDNVLFWLDAHYSGGITASGEKETPIEEELKSILSLGHIGDVILIDDARLFVGDNDYPTIPQLKKMILSRRPQVDIEIEDDIIQIFPKALKNAG